MKEIEVKDALYISCASSDVIVTRWRDDPECDWIKFLVHSHEGEVCNFSLSRNELELFLARVKRLSDQNGDL